MTLTFHLSLAVDQILIKKGQSIDFKTPLTKEVSSKSVKIQLAQRLQIEPKNIFMHLNKVVGDEVEKGEVIARKKTLFGEKKYASEAAGKISEINHEEGSIIISTKGKTEKVQYAFFKGEVEEIKGSTVSLKVANVKSFKTKNVSRDFGGKVFFAPADGLDHLTEEQIEDRVLFADTYPAYNRVKFEVMGARGFVTNDEAEEDAKSAHATLVDKKELEEIKNLKYPYCLATKKDSLVFLYQ